MKKDVLVSIIIPCYNVSEFVEKAVNSILAQTYKNLEVWIIDDASNDDTLQKIKSIKDDRIKLIAFKENTQKIGAVNEVLKKVNGDYIAFQDADDWSEPDRIEKQLNAFFTKVELGICFTKFKYTGFANTVPKNIFLSDSDLKYGFLNFHKDNVGSLLPACATMMISKLVLERHPGYHNYFKGRVAEDIHWVNKILKDFEGFTIDEVLYYYQIRNNSLTQQQVTAKQPKYLYSWHLLSKILKMGYSDGIDVLAIENKELLNSIELEACEEALLESTKSHIDTRRIYEDSMSFKVGKFVLLPYRKLNLLLKKLLNK